MVSLQEVIKDDTLTIDTPHEMQLLIQVKA